MAHSNIPDYFDRDAQRARDAAGYKDHPKWDHPWSWLARGRSLGRRVCVNFSAPNSVSAAQSSSVELLRVDPKGDEQDQLAQQMCLTLGAPFILPAGGSVQDPTVIPGGVQDNIQVANTLSNAGGTSVGAAGSDVAFANPVVTIHWGTGSIENRAECDVANGLCVNLVASFLRVTARVESCGLTVTSAPYVFSANLGPGYPKSNNAQRTIVVGPVANAGISSVFCVPRFAKSVIVTASDGSNAPPLVAGTISFWRSQGGSVDGFGVGDFFFAGNSPIKIPVPNGAYYFTIEGATVPSGGGFVTPRYSATFELAI